MSKPNWNEAPADATHWGPETDDFHESWYKCVRGVWACLAVDSYREFKPAWYGMGYFQRQDLEPRP